MQKRRSVSLMLKWNPEEVQQCLSWFFLCNWRLNGFWRLVMKVLHSTYLEWVGGSGGNNLVLQLRQVFVHRSPHDQEFRLCCLTIFHQHIQKRNPGHLSCWQSWTLEFHAEYAARASRSWGEDIPETEKAIFSRTAKISNDVVILLYKVILGVTTNYF